MNVNAFNFVFSRVDLNDKDIRVVGQLLGSFFVVGGKSLAMTTPGSIEFD